MSRSGQPLSSTIHLTEIKMLIRHNEQLLERLLMPASTLGSMALPYILSPFLEEGRLLHSLYVMIAMQRYESRWAGNLAVTIPTELKMAGLRITNLTQNQELVVHALTNFHDVIIKHLVSLRIVKRLGGSPLEYFLQKTIFEMLQTEVIALETHRLPLLPTDDYAEIKISAKIKTDLKKEFLKAYLSLSSLRKLPNKEMDIFNKPKTIQQTENRVNLHYTADIAILQKSFYEIVGMLNGSYQQLIYEFKLEDNGVALTTNSPIHNDMVNYFISPHFILIPIITGVLLQKYGIYPPIKWLYRKYTAVRFLLNPVKNICPAKTLTEFYNHSRKKMFK